MIIDLIITIFFNNEFNIIKYSLIYEFLAYNNLNFCFEFVLFSFIGFIQGNHFSLNQYIYIFFISFFSNTFSAIAGGGAGLIQLPALILTGIPYQQALAIHKLATVALGLGSSLRNYKSLRNYLGIVWQILIF